jgi:SulP family sulfate permease
VSETAILERIVPGVGVLRSYERAHLRHDIPAALGLWALLIPQGLAYAQLAGMPPVTGLYTGLVATVAYALFGTSRYLNMGPESSTAILVAGSILPLSRGDPARAVALAGMLALLTGGVLLAGYVLRLGVITRLLSSPILTGFLAGSAVVMAVTQLPKAFGFPVDPEQYPLIVGGIVVGIAKTNPWALGIALGTIVVMVVLQRTLPRLPAGFIALVLATVAVAVGGLADQVSVIGDIPRGIPAPSFPSVGLRAVMSLLVPAASVALLVFSGSVLTAQALAARDGEDVDANREFVGLAIGNLAAGFAGGFPAAGSESRSFVVAAGGGRTQVTGLVAAGLVLLTLLVLTPLFHDVPDAALGGVVLVTAAKLFDTRAMRYLWRVRRADFLLMAITFGGVLLTGVLGGIVIGVIASLAEMVRRTIQPRTAVLGMVEGAATWRNVREHESAETIPGLIVYRFDAPLFFGNADVLRNQVRDLVRSAPDPVRAVILNMEAVTDLDTTGAQVMERLLDDLGSMGVRLSLARVRTHVREMLARTGLEEKIAAENIHPTVQLAVDSARRPGGSNPPSEGST